MIKNVICDRCNKTFVVTKTRKKFFKDGDKGTVVFHYFECPFCKERYSFHIESDEIKRLVKKQKRLRNKIPGTIDEKQLDKIYKEMDDLKNKIKAMNAEYKALFKLDKR
ncbi:hypothetical protein OEV98_11045 [Caldibacillus lycopersici]|uniref:Transglycosylase n=1 Tax=Perspicuibacillus lycopersici TaxID=1325689 RepID=A0AAE3LNP2_9BACI|nr:hypothetical protein [Perspicuibacillus lycopersici]MCU9614096.1 hypothetical protein [Perspicuibacillus lycopersici]